MRFWIPLIVMVGCSEDPSTECTNCPVGGESGTSGGHSTEGGGTSGGHTDPGTGGKLQPEGGNGGEAGLHGGAGHDGGFGGESEPTAGRGGSGGETGGDDGGGGAGQGGGSCALTELQFELISPSGFVWFGHRPLGAGPLPRADYGVLHAGSGYKISVGTQSATECSSSSGFSEIHAVPFDVVAGETTELHLMLPCPGRLACVEVVFAVDGSAEECPPLVVTPASGPVGSSLSVALPELPSGERTVSLDPYAIVAAFGVSPSPTELEVKCRAAGTAKLHVDSTEGPCGGFRQEADVVCTPMPNSECCPLGTIQELQSDGCVALGGSPPCYTGCDCLRDGGSISSASDANGCLEWSIKRSRSGGSIACLDENGDVNPDPRKLCGTFAVPEAAPPAPDCSASAISRALDPLDTVCASTAARTCDAAGTWRVTFPNFDTSLIGSRCVENAPPEVELLLTAPGDFKVSANGCDLTYQHSEEWENESECGAFGYTLYLQVDGDQASGSLHSVETGFCSGEARDFATAVRLP